MTSNASSRLRVSGRNPLQAFRNMALRTKLAILFVAVAIIAVGSVSYLTITSITTAFTEHVYAGLIAVAETQGQNIGTFLARHVRSMQSWTNAPEIQTALASRNASYHGDKTAGEWASLDAQWKSAGPGDPLLQAHLDSEIAQRLREFMRDAPEFAEAFITDRYGGLLAAGARTSDYYQADEGWWQSAYNNGQGAVFIAEPEFDESAGVIGINMAVPVYAAGEEVIGIMRTTLDVTELLGEFNITIGETGELVFVFPSGMALIPGRYGEEAEQIPLDPAILTQLESGPQRHTEMIWDKDPSLVGWATVTSSGEEKYISDLAWKVVVHQRQDEALAPVWQARNAAIITATAIILVASVIASLVGRAVANPLAGLNETVKRFAAGDLNARAESRSSDEIGTLAHNFNQMADRIGSLLTEIQTRNAELAERTRELEAGQRVTLAASEHVSPDELLDLVVNLIRDQFNLYHAQVYIVDREQGAAVLRQSTGYAGRQLLQRKHKIPLDATALVTKAIRTGEPVLVADVTRDPDFMSNPLLPETKSELVVPLKLGDEIIGALDAQDRIPGRFGPSTVALFQSMADQIAILFENSNLLTRLTEQTEALTAFTNQLRVAAEIARRLGTILDPDQVLEQVVELLQSRFGLYHAHVYLLDEATGRLVMRAGAGEVGRVLRKRGHFIPLDAERSMVARAAREHETIVSNDTTQEPNFLPNPLLPQTRSEASIPLTVGDRVLGVLDIQDERTNRFGQVDIDTFTTLAGHVAIALQNAIAFEQTQLRLRVSRALVGARTEEDVLNVLAGQPGLYPQASVDVMTVERGEDGSLTLVSRRSLSFESGIPPTPQGTRFPIPGFPLVDLITPDTPFASPNVFHDERVDEGAREFARQKGWISLAIFPITTGENWLGAIIAASRQEAYFDAAKLTLYQTLAEQGATALQIARLNDESLRTAERLKEVDRLKSEFLASMSHELRTPLNSIIGYTEVMLMGLDGEIDPELREDVQAIYDNSQHLLNLINDVLDLAKIEAGRLTLNMEEVPLRSVVDAAVSSVAGLLVNKPIKFEVEVGEDLPAIWGDRVRLTQILNNLLSNAIKFTDEGRVTLRAFTRDGWACLEVEDTGIGISEADQKKLFERFQQIDGSNTRKRGGTGLGLAITRHLVTLHGGTITVKSKLGEGSTFTVYLPLDARPREGKARA